MSEAYAQLLSVGLLWITFHCAGMCGPLVIGLDVAGVGRGLPTWRGVLRIAAYQLGRMTTLATLGALVGLAGRGLVSWFQPAGAIMSLAFGVGLAGTLVARQLRKRRARAAPVRVTTRLEGRVGRTRQAKRTPWNWVRAVSLSSTPGGTWLLGVLMGFLPCMIVMWALGLAATTGSPLDGALVMALLVAMTTPMLLGVTLLPRALPARAMALLPTLLMGLSATWLVTIGLAGLELVPHVHVAAGEFTVMLW